MKSGPIGFHMAFKDLTGKRVGKLTVISFYGWIKRLVKYQNEKWSDRF